MSTPPSNLQQTDIMQEQVREESGGRKTGWSARLRRYRVLLLGVTALVIIGITAVLFVVSTRTGKTEPRNRSLSQKLQQLEFDDFLQNKFGAPPFSANGTWLSDVELLFVNEKHDLAIFNFKSNTETLLVPSGVLSELKVPGQAFVWVSPSQNFVLMASDVQKRFRHSFAARYYIYDIHEKEVINVTLRSPLTRIWMPYPPNLPFYFFLAKWAPTEDRLILVFQNDIYYLPDPRGNREFQITADGRPDIFFNGIADWVYEEEVLGDSSAVKWSKDSKKLAFISFNDTNVPLMEYPIYRPYSVHNQYPIIFKLHYPKAGTENPDVKVWVVDLEALESNPPAAFKFPILPPPVFQDQEHYVTGMSWSGDSHLAVNWLNRHQNHSVTSLCSETKDGTRNWYSCRVDLDLNNTEGWFEIPTPKFSSSPISSDYLIILPHEGWKKLFKVSFSSLSQPLTPTGFEVTEVYKWDLEKDRIFIQGVYRNASSKRGVFQIEVGKMTCLSCASSPGEDCSYASAFFSRNASYYALQCATPTTVANQVTIKETESGEAVREWLSNDQLVKELNTKALPVEKNLEVEVASGFTAQVRLFLPPDLDEAGSTKYPMIVYTYGGPNSKQITDGWRGVDWGTYLSGTQGIIHAMIDGRGSGYRGEQLLYQLYRRLGSVEVEDQINVTRTLVRDLRYIDGSRVGIWGWSYGGFTAAMALATDTEHSFKCAISVAPVTSWLYYDSIYTERYMGLPTPEDNLAAYESGTMLTPSKLENFRNKSFYLIHGNADDNVHYQQSMLLSKELELRDILFRQQSYPDENHGLGGVRPHVYHSMLEFWKECFNLA